MVGEEDEEEMSSDGEDVSMLAVGGRRAATVRAMLC